MPRRINRNPSGRGWDFWNFIATIGSFVIALSVLVFIINVIKTRKTAKVGEDPWDARTLEWLTPNPPPEYNFAEIPIVTSRDELWHRKYAEDEHGRPVPRAVPEVESEPARLETSDIGELEAPSGNGDGDGALPVPADQVAREEAVEEAAHEEGHEPHIHMPTPSYYPLLASLGLPVICYGLMYKAWPVSLIGGLLTLGSLYGWALEPATEPEEPEDVTEPEPEPEPEPEAELEPAPTGPSA
jgi:cytochrome c oxidase subunit 1